MGSVTKTEKTQSALLEIFDVFVYVTVLDNVFWDKSREVFCPICYHFSSFQHNETLSQLYALLEEVRPCVPSCRGYLLSLLWQFKKYLWLLIQPLVCQCVTFSELRKKVQTIHFSSLKCKSAHPDFAKGPRVSIREQQLIWDAAAGVLTKQRSTSLSFSESTPASCVSGFVSEFNLFFLILHSIV